MALCQLLAVLCLLPTATSSAEVCNTLVPPCSTSGSSLLQFASRSLFARRHGLEGSQGQINALTDADYFGPAAPAVVALEVLLERPSGLYGPAHKGETAQTVLFWTMIAISVTMLFIAVPFIGIGNDLHCCAEELGKTIAEAIETFDKSILGVDVEIGSFSINMSEGYMDLERLIIRNPPDYNSAYLLKAEQVLVDVNMPRLIKSCTNEVVIDSLVLKDIHAIMEKSLETSNMQEVLHYITSANQDDDSAAPPPSPPVPTVSSGKLSRQRTIKSKLPVGKKSKDRHFMFHKVEIQDVGVTLRPSGEVGEYVRLNIEAGDVYYHDFHREVGHSALPAIFREMLSSILKTLIANIAGKEVGNYLM